MIRLQVNTADGWRFVFCHNNGRIVTTDKADKALDKYALEYFQERFANNEFRLINPK